MNGMTKWNDTKGEEEEEELILECNLDVRKLRMEVLFLLLFLWKKNYDTSVTYVHT